MKRAWSRVLHTTDSNRGLTLDLTNWDYGDLGRCHIGTRASFQGLRAECGAQPRQRAEKLGDLGRGQHWRGDRIQRVCSSAEVKLELITRTFLGS